MCLVCQASEEADKSYESTDTLKKLEVCQKNGQSLGEADECGKSLTHFEVCQSVSEISLSCRVRSFFCFQLLGGSFHFPIRKWNVIFLVFIGE